MAKMQIQVENRHELYVVLVSKLLHTNRITMKNLKE